MTSPHVSRVIVAVYVVQGSLYTDGFVGPGNGRNQCVRIEFDSQTYTVHCPSFQSVTYTRTSAVYPAAIFSRFFDEVGSAAAAAGPVDGTTIHKVAVTVTLVPSQMSKLFLSFSLYDHHSLAIHNESQCIGNIINILHCANNISHTALNAVRLVSWSWPRPVHRVDMRSRSSGATTVSRPTVTCDVMRP